MDAPMKQPGREDIPENQMSRILRELDRAVLRGSGDAAAHGIGQRGGPAGSGCLAQQQAGGPLRRPYTGQYSIRINSRWRICFRWGDDGPYDVEVVDYH